jgi:hypothetical protein
MGPLAGAAESRSVRTRHPLLGAFPLTVLTLGAVLIVFAFSMAALNGDDSDLRGGAGLARAAVSHAPSVPQTP